jgi:hypothetical protein
MSAVRQARIVAKPAGVPGSTITRAPEQAFQREVSTRSRVWAGSSAKV